MSDSHHDSSCMRDKTSPPVTYAVAAAEAIREATSRMQLAREVPEQLGTDSLAAVGAALMDITRGLAQFAEQIDAALPDSVTST